MSENHEQFRPLRATTTLRGVAVMPEAEVVSHRDPPFGRAAHGLSHFHCTVHSYLFDVLVTTDILVTAQ